MGSDCYRHRIQFGLPSGWGSSGGGGICLSGDWSTDGGFGDLKGYPGGSGMCTDFCGDLHHFEFNRRYHRNHQQSPASPSKID